VRRILAGGWLGAVAVALAALIHVTDAGIDGVGGLLSAKALPSLALLALLLTGLEAPSLIAFVRGGWRGLAVAVTLTGVLIGLALAAAGVSTTSAARFTWSVLGGSAVAIAFLLVGVLPAAGVGWSRAVRSTEG
jgi:hypothetical protein